MKRPARWASATVLGAALATSATSASAADPPPQGLSEITARERPSTRSFYGWQILASGEAGGILGAAGMVLPDSPFKTLPSTFAIIVGVPLYALGGPATHWTHGAFEKGLISLGANIAFPLAGGLIGQSVHCAQSDAPVNCGLRGFSTGFAIALVTVPVFDALLLGWEDIPDDEAPSVLRSAMPSGEVAEVRRVRRPRAASFTMAPAWNIGPRGELAFGFAGRF